MNRKENDAPCGDYFKCVFDDVGDMSIFHGAFLFCMCSLWIREAATVDEGDEDGSLSIFVYISCELVFLRFIDLLLVWVDADDGAIDSVDWLEDEGAISAGVDDVALYSGACGEACSVKGC